MSYKTWYVKQPVIHLMNMNEDMLVAAEIPMGDQSIPKHLLQGLQITYLMVIGLSNWQWRKWNYKLEFPFSRL